jgi:hypothetical protein
MTLTYSSFVPPTGNVAPTLIPPQNPSSFKASFGTTATFSGGDCAPGEYRQYVKGTFKANGSTVQHVLCGSVILLPAVFQEDGCPPNGCTAYGYRRCPQNPINQYTPLRASGCQYSMNDMPGFSNIQSKTTYNVDLSFEGKLIDTSRGGLVLVTGAWTTSGSTTVEEFQLSASSVGLTATDRIIGVHRARNEETGAAELHVVITRPAGQPRFDAAAIKLTLIDGAGLRAPQPQSPAVYEVGNQTRSTVSIVYTLAAGASTPVKAELEANSGLVTLKVADR